MNEKDREVFRALGYTDAQINKITAYHISYADELTTEEQALKDGYYHDVDYDLVPYTEPENEEAVSENERRKTANDADYYPDEPSEYAPDYRTENVETEAVAAGCGGRKRR